MPFPLGRGMGEVVTGHVRRVVLEVPGVVYIQLVGVLVGGEGQRLGLEVLAPQPGDEDRGRGHPWDEGSLVSACGYKHSSVVFAGIKNITPELEIVGSLFIFKTVQRNYTAQNYGHFARPVQGRLARQRGRLLP